MSIRKGNNIIASKPTIDNSVTQDSPNAVAGGAVYTALQAKQNVLISGTNIKTINSNSLLGSGDLTIDSLPSQTGHSGELLTTNGTSASWTAIKTINSSSLIGSGNIDVLVNEATPASSLGIGYTTVNTTYADSINIGNGAQVGANNALALGAFASAEGQDSIAIYSSTGTAHRARTTHTGNIAIGYNALAINAPYTIAIGYNAFAQSTNAIQLGTGNNASSGTMQVWTHKLLDKTSGLIPSARLADQTSATQGQVLTLDSNLDAIWANAGSGSGYHPDLFDFKWADHELNDVQWLRADTFSWQAGSVYESAYNHLADDIDGKSLTSETVAGTTIQFYLADDGHKICPSSEESNVTAIYTATGVAWYYIIDTVNERFKLPRTQYGVTGLRDTVGNYVAESLPNITGAFDIPSYNTNNIAIVSSGAFSSAQTGGTARAIGYADQQYARGHTTLDASRSSSAYQDSAPVQERATQMYLYFYVGEFTQTALENTAGVVTEDFNELNAHKVIEFQAPNAGNNYTWYRKYADGWVEQGGVFDTGGDQTASAPWVITLPVVMDSVNYTGLASMGGRTSGGGYGSYCVVPDSERTTTTLYVYAFKTETAYRYINWRVCGIAA